MTYLLDTNVVSELRRRAPDPAVVAWFATVDGADLFLSVLVVGEIEQGIERLRQRDAVRARALTTWLDGLRSSFAHRIAPVSLDVALTWGRLNATRPLPVVDGLLAATALTRGWTLVRRNERDLADTGVSLLNPFT